MPIPHLLLRDREDRSWTFTLLERLAAAEVGTAERDAIAGSLTCLEDPRATLPLVVLLEDRGRPAAVREAAGAVLRGMGNPPPGPTLRAWWRTEDAVLRRHALLSMGRAEADIIEPVLADPGHPLHLEAIVSAEFGFDEPSFQGPRIAALGHPDPRVRRAAAEALVWDEPSAAEAALLRAATDSDAGVAIAAAKTLENYASRRALQGLADLVQDRRGAVAAEAVEALENLRQSFLSALIRAPGSERAALCAWMDPVWSILGFTSEDLARPSDSPRSRATPLAGAIPAAELRALYSDPDGLWADKKALVNTLDPRAFAEADRVALTPFLATHGDPWVRERATHWLAAWGDHAMLLHLAREDAAFVVRKSAVFGLGLVRPTPAVAVFAWDHLQVAGTSSTHAYETLRTYVAHASIEAARPRLVALAREDARETVRAHAVHELSALQARAELVSLYPLLDEPPRVTWAVHLALLEAVSRLDLEVPRLDALRAVDDLEVQSALAALAVEER